MAIVISVVALILSIVGIVVSACVAIYVHKESSEQNIALHEDSKREERVVAVVDEYRRLLNSNKSSDIPALIQAGMANLLNEAEASDTIRRIADLQGQRNPLSSKKNDIEAIGILKFFKNITYDDYRNNKIDEVISNLRS
jgi:hypothetical protein